MGKKTLTLDDPILINGKQVTELTYDPMEITAAQFSEACSRSAALDKAKSVTFKMRQSDYALHLYLGMMAVIAVNPDIDISDLERIKGYDVLELTDIGMLFIYRRWEATSKENNSEERSENTVDTSTPTSKKLEK